MREESRGTFLGDPFLATRLSRSMRAGVLESARKVALLRQSTNQDLLAGQTQRREALVLYAENHYTAEALAAVTA